MNCMCWICWENAERRAVAGDWVNIECHACGRYFISREFMRENKGRTLDVEAMRYLISDAMSAGVSPTIGNGTARFVTSNKCLT